MSKMKNLIEKVTEIIETDQLTLNEKFEVLSEIIISRASLVKIKNKMQESEDQKDNFNMVNKKIIGIPLEAILSIMEEDYD